MKKFLLILLAFFGIPLLLLLGLYLWTDPFRTLHTFDINNVNSVNREYVSTELYLRNKDTYRYNAFVFGSSQASGLNTYTWKMYLPESASTFLFQGWSDEIVGVKEKLEWLDANGANIKYALILMDMPGFFDMAALESHSPLAMHHYALHKQPKWQYHAWEYINYIQKPSEWINFTKIHIKGTEAPLETDPITNDWLLENAENFKEIPKQDSLSQCSEQTRRTFFLLNLNVSEKDVKMASTMIDDSFMPTLQAVKSIFDKQHTDYYIIITPVYRYTHPYINLQDLEKLQNVFGADRVYDFSSRVEYTSDYNDFFDPVHFGTRLGWFMLREVYTKEMKNE